MPTPAQLPHARPTHPWPCLQVVKVRYGGVVEWEGGENRLAELPRPTAGGARAAYTVKVGPSGVAVEPSVAA